MIFLNKYIASRSDLVTVSVPVLGDDVIGVCWLRLLIVEPLISLSWEVSVSGVVNVFSWEEIVWFVEFIKLMGCENFVIFNTITIFVINFLPIGVCSFFPYFIIKSLQFSLKGH